MSLGNLLAVTEARLAGHVAARHGLTVHDAPVFFQNVELAYGHNWSDLLRFASEEELQEAYVRGVEEFWSVRKED